MSHCFTRPNMAPNEKFVFIKRKEEDRLSVQRDQVNGHLRMERTQFEDGIGRRNLKREGGACGWLYKLVFELIINYLI